MPANRVAALAAFLTGIAAALAGVEGALPTGAANAVAMAVGVIGSIVTSLHFMSGSQKYDALTVKSAHVAPLQLAGTANTTTSSGFVTSLTAPLPEPIPGEDTLEPALDQADYTTDGGTPPLDIVHGLSPEPDPEAPTIVPTVSLGPSLPTSATVPPVA